MIIGILKEPAFENRVALLPEHLVILGKLGVKCQVETNAGDSAFVANGDYTNVGADVVSRNECLSNADIIISIHPVEADDLRKLKPVTAIISVFNPLSNASYVDELRNQGKTAFSLDMIPRVTRGQAMDILSSMATVAGYKAVLESAMLLPKFFPMFMTAAGTITPAKVLILGAGVAGLQAVATARKLGAQVYVFDVRAAVKEQVLSLGGKFVEVEGAKDDVAAGGYAVEQTDDFKMSQQEAIHNQAIKSDIIICTAQIPGKKAPVLIKKETIEAMKPGSVIIDIAASTGGNTELTQNNCTIEHHGVKILGQSNYPSTMPGDASKMFGTNVVNLLKLMVDKQGGLQMDFKDEIIAGCCITHQGQIMNDRVKTALNKE